MALLSRASRTATVVAKTDGETLRIPPEAFEELLKSSSTAAMAVLRWVMARLNQNESLLHQQEKMAALGTLSAGLAHELNNPAAAAQRNAAELGRTLFKLQALNHQIESRALKENLAGWLDSFVRETSRRFSSPVKLDALERIDRVDELQSWLEERQIEPAWELAPALVSFGWSAGELENLRENVLFEVIVQWLGIACLTIARVSEIQQAMERISSIVQAVKSYTYLDQARLLEVDIHEGLENTLVIMQHKLKRGISVRRDYSPNLPRIEAYASELNQVWTNIIDNAIDAMNGSGEITLRTYAENDSVVVEIADNGPGIPANIQSRIFEPFFTTKPPGQGTGLGLHISHDIVVNRHHGQLLLDSRPGETKFKVILPVKISLRETIDKGEKNGTR
jgi:signal transduction histidine kinase